MKKLLCTFSNKNKVVSNLIKIKENFIIIDNRIELFSLDNEENIMVYAIEKKDEILPQRTLIVHKKNEYNTIYTLNALNHILKNMNNGILNKGMEINWQNYQDKLIIEKNGELFQRNISFIETIS